MSELIDVGKLGSVLAFGLAGGAGLVAVFALGLTGFSAPRQDVSGGGNNRVTSHSPAGLVLAFVCFAIVVAGVMLGLYVMLAA